MQLLLEEIMSSLCYIEIVNMFTKDQYRSLFFPAFGCLYFDSKSTVMKNKKKVIEVITEFPVILYTLKTDRREEATDYILDASNYAQPTNLLTVANPDCLFLNLKLPFTSAIEIVNNAMEESNYLKVGMIVKDQTTFYERLCASFAKDYLVDSNVEVKKMPAVISYRQLN